MHENHVDGDALTWSCCSPLKSKSVGGDFSTSKGWNSTCFRNKTDAMTASLLRISSGINALKESEGAREGRACYYKCHWDERRESKGSHSDDPTWEFLHFHCLWRIASIFMPMHGCFFSGGVWNGGTKWVLNNYLFVLLGRNRGGGSNPVYSL